MCSAAGISCHHRCGILDWLLLLHVLIELTSSQDLFEESSEYLLHAADAAYKPEDHRELQCSGLMRYAKALA